MSLYHAHGGRSKGALPIIIATEDLLGKLRAWTDQGNHFVAIVDSNRYPDLLPIDETCGCNFYEIQSVDELSAGTELISLYIDTIDFLIPCRFDDAESLQDCDWQLAVVVNMNEHYERQLAKAQSALIEHLENHLVNN